MMEELSTTAPASPSPSLSLQIIISFPQITSILINRLTEIDTLKKRLTANWVLPSGTDGRKRRCKEGMRGGLTQSRRR